MRIFHRGRFRKPNRAQRIRMGMAFSVVYLFDFFRVFLSYIRGLEISNGYTTRYRLFPSPQGDGDVLARPSLIASIRSPCAARTAPIFSPRRWRAI